MSNKPVSDFLKTLLADYYTLYLKTQNYHWNVEGPNFKSLHQQFEEQYQELVEVIDTVAELIRGLGEKAPGTFEAYSAITSLKPGDEQATSQQMLADILSDQEKIQNILHKGLEIAQTAKDEVVAGFIVERLTYHRKLAWMLKSSH